MYLKIENEFKIKSNFLKQNKILTLSCVFLVSVLVIIYNFAKEKSGVSLAIFSFFIGFVIMIFVFYILIYFKYTKKEKRSFSSFFRLNETIQTYQETIHTNDLKMLESILKKHKINTRSKIEQAIKHYQCLLPRKIEQSGQFLNILAITISVLALFLSDTVLNSNENIVLIMENILIVVILYIVIGSFKKNVLKVFSKNSLYERIESSLSEIFMLHYYKKIDKKGED